MSIYIGDAAKPETVTMSGVEIPFDQVSISIFHTGIFARSGMGKTTLIKSMIQQAVEQGFRVLIFDSKITEPEFEGMGTTIPFYLQENTDPDVYRSLIEGVRTRGHGNMERYRSAFIQICEPHGGIKARDFAVIEARLEEKLANPKIRGYTADMYSEIYHDHLKLKEMLKQHEFSTDVIGALANGVGGNYILRMPVRNLPNLNLQGLVIRSTIDAILRLPQTHELIIVVDEAPNFVNQSLYNPAKSALAQLDAQGRSKSIFGWYTGQTLTGFDKRNMKNLQEWILGGEMERNEVKAVYQTQTDRVLTQDQIKKLKVREFIVSTPDWSKLVKVPDLRITVDNIQGVMKIIDTHIAVLNDYRQFHEKNGPDSVYVPSEELRKMEGKVVPLTKDPKMTLEKHSEMVDRMRKEMPLRAHGPLEPEPTFHTISTPKTKGFFYEQFKNELEADSSAKETPEEARRREGPNSLAELKALNREADKQRSPVSLQGSSEARGAKPEDAMRGLSVVGSNPTPPHSVHWKVSEIGMDGETIIAEKDFATKQSKQLLDDSTRATVQLEKIDLEYVVSHRSVRIQLTTEDKGGQLAYMLKTHGPQSANALEKLAPDFAWKIDRNHISDYVKQAKGAVVPNEGGGWRLAKFVNVEAKYPPKPQAATEEDEEK